MRLKRFVGGQYQGRVHCDLEFPLKLAENPLSAAFLAGAEVLLKCDGRRIVRTELPIRGRPCPIFFYVLQNHSWNRAFRPDSARHIFRMSETLRRLGFDTPEVLAALKPKRQMLNWKSLLVTREISNVSELPSTGNHVFQVHPPAAMTPELIRSFADLLARIHDSGFFHGDLKSRHVLVRKRDDGWRFFLVDLEKSRYAPELPRLYQDLMAARDLIQLFASLPSQPVPPQSNSLETAFLNSYFAARELTFIRRKRIHQWLNLYRPGSSFRQGETVLAALLSGRPASPPKSAFAQIYREKSGKTESQRPILPG